MSYKDPIANREKILKQKRDWYQRNKDKHKAYYEENKERLNEYSKNYHQENKEKITKLRKDRIQEQREYILLKKSEPCYDCNLCYPYYVMDFDHVRGEKKYLVSRFMKSKASWETINKELDKCDLVCSNCHRIRTHERNQRD